MYSLRVLLVTLSAAFLVNGQVYFGEERAPDAFTYLQPQDTTIQGQYGHSEPIYPCRKPLNATGFALISNYE